MCCRVQAPGDKKENPVVVLSLFLAQTGISVALGVLLGKIILPSLLCDPPTLFSRSSRNTVIAGKSTFVAGKPSRASAPPGKDTFMKGGAMMQSAPALPPRAKSGSPKKQKDRLSCAPLTRRSAATRALIGACCASLLGIALQLMQTTVVVLTGWVAFLEEQFGEAYHIWEFQNPLITLMIAGFTLVNFTQAGHVFHNHTHFLSGPVFLLFFVLTGASMDLATLWRNAGAAFFLFTIRSTGIVSGTLLGGVLANQHKVYTTKYWMAFLTQAGVALGLAGQASQPWLSRSSRARARDGKPEACASRWRRNTRRGGLTCRRRSSRSWCATRSLDRP